MIFLPIWFTCLQLQSTSINMRTWIGKGRRSRAQSLFTRNLVSWERQTRKWLPKALHKCRKGHVHKVSEDMSHDTRTHNRYPAAGSPKPRRKDLPFTTNMQNSSSLLEWKPQIHVWLNPCNASHIFLWTDNVRFLTEIQFDYCSIKLEKVIERL